MLIDSLAPNPDAVETHFLNINASPEVVYRALWTADLGRSLIIKSLLALRSLPELIVHPRQPLPQDRKVTLQTLIDAGFGVLAEQPGKEIVLGVSGRFWRPMGNLSAFNRADFDAPPPAGLARAVWNFHVEGVNDQTILSTETRVTCGDRRSRRKFRAYWFFVRPFSGLIRRLMLRAVRLEAHRNSDRSRQRS